jgi:hypothetical protein
VVVDLGPPEVRRRRQVRGLPRQRQGRDRRVRAQDARFADGRVRRARPGSPTATG